MSIKDFVTDLAEVRSISPKPYVERHQARQTEELHKGVIMKGQVAHVNNVLMRLTELVYSPSDDGERDNVDPYTGRILIPAPWGSKGREYFGLSRRTADILRQCLLHKRPTARPLLYVYDRDTNAWYVDLATYPTLAEAMYWVRYEAIDLAEWRQAGNEVRKRVAAKGQ